MKRLLSLALLCCFLTSMVGCCYRNRCCRSSCDPCGGGCGVGAPGAMPYGYGPTGQIMNQTYGSVPSTTVNGPVASTTSAPTYTDAGTYTAQAPVYTQTGYAPRTAALPLNPLPTF